MDKPKKSASELAAEKEALKRVTQARTSLLLDQPFFGALALRLTVEVSAQCSTMGTDGKKLMLNPKFVEKLSPKELEGVMAHEILHIACGHPWRESSLPFPPVPKECPPEHIGELQKMLRHVKANVAGDFAINPVVKEAGLTIPDGGCYDKKYEGMSLEEIYAKLPDPEVRFQPNGSPKVGKGDAPCGPGETMPTPDPSKAAEDQAEWKIAVAQAANAAKQQGKLPASLERFSDKLLKPVVDWRAVLRRFVQQACKMDYTWKTPASRYLASGWYLPSIRDERIPPMVVWIDTSGSIGEEELAQFYAEIVDIVRTVKPARLYVGYCDAEAHRVDVFEADEEVLFKAVGGGGTDFRPAFKWNAEHIEEDVACMIYLTDLYGTFPDEAPNYPILWCATTDLEVPFGEVVKLEPRS